MNSHNEQDMERAHQKGKKDDRRLRCLNRNPEKKALNILSREATFESDAVQLMLKDTNDKPRSIKQKIVTSSVEDRRGCLNPVMALTEILSEFPTMLDLQTIAAQYYNELDTLGGA